MARLTFPKPGEVVRDIEGRRYKLSSILGQGAQGTVFTTDDTNLLVKVCVTPRSGHPEPVRDRLRVLTLRNLKADALVLPRAVLAEPHLGYVMDRVQDAIPLSCLAYPCDGNPTWHETTGGLRRRLRICAELARTFQQIHSSGLCYVDLSMQNVLVPLDPKATSIRLIDPDNLIVPGTSLVTVLGTSGFIAPERLIDESRFPDHACDRWSLAVAIFYLLVLNHPFLGDEVQNGEPKLEESALRGELPFIDSRIDERNRSNLGGLPRGRVLTRRLKELCSDAFERGVGDRTARPDPEEWLSALEEAADQTALCQHCGATSYLPGLRVAQFVCDWCGKSNPRPIELGFFNPDPSIDNLDANEQKELKRHKTPHRLVLETSQRTVPARLVSGDLTATGDAGLFGFKRTTSGDKLYVLKNLSADTWHTKDNSDRILTCKPGEFVWLFDQTLIAFLSGVRAKIRNIM